LANIIPIVKFDMHSYSMKKVTNIQTSTNKWVRLMMVYSLKYYFLKDFFLETMNFKAQEDAEHDYSE